MQSFIMVFVLHEYGITDIGTAFYHNDKIVSMSL